MSPNQLNAYTFCYAQPGGSGLVAPPTKKLKIEVSAVRVRLSPSPGHESPGSLAHGKYCGGEAKPIPTRSLAPGETRLTSSRSRLRFVQQRRHQRPLVVDSSVAQVASLVSALDEHRAYELRIGTRPLCQTKRKRSPGGSRTRLSSNSSISTLYHQGTCSWPVAVIYSASRSMPLTGESCCARTLC